MREPRGEQTTIGGIKGKGGLERKERDPGVKMTKKEKKDVTEMVEKTSGFF